MKEENMSIDAEITTELIFDSASPRHAIGAALAWKSPRLKLEHATALLEAFAKMERADRQFAETVRRVR